MIPTCITCGRPVEEGATCCHQCLAEINDKIKICKKCNRPAAKGADLCHTCLEKLFTREYIPSGTEPNNYCENCGDEITYGRTLCDFCLAKANLPQSYPPSIVPAAVDAMKAALIDSALLRLEEIEAQAAALKMLLMNLKGAGV